MQILRLVALGAQAVGDALHVLGPAAVRDQQRVLGLDDQQVLHADRRGRRCASGMKVLRVSSASAPDDAVALGVGAEPPLTARQEPMSLHSKLAGTIATRAEFTA